MGKLENISVEYLREVWEKVEDATAARRLAPAILYKEIDEMTQTKAATTFGYSSGWASIWFDRLERLAEEPFEDVVYDEDRSGRPAKLSEQQREEFEHVLHQSPTAVGLDAPAWTVPLARKYLQEELGVGYSARHVRRLLREAGLSWKTPRPKFDNADERAQEAWPKGFKKSRAIWTTDIQSSR